MAKCHHTAFMVLKEAIVQAPILCYPDPTRRYIVYMDVSDDACRAQLSQEHDRTEFLIAFLSHMFTVTQRKWSTPEQEAYRVYYAITKWNYYLQGADIVVCNNSKPLAKFLKWKECQQQGQQMENGTLQPTSGARNKATDCLSRLVKLPTNGNTNIKMLTAHQSGWTSQSTQEAEYHTKAKQLWDKDPSGTPPIKETVTLDLTTMGTTQDITPKPLTANRH